MNMGYEKGPKEASFCSLLFTIHLYVGLNDFAKNVYFSVNIVILLGFSCISKSKKKKNLCWNV